VIEEANYGTMTPQDFDRFGRDRRVQARPDTVIQRRTYNPWASRPSAVDVEVDYGTQAADEVDRFGAAQTYYIWERVGPRRGERRTIVPSLLGAPIKRLGLTLKRWTWVWTSQHSDYFLDIHGRNVEITHYRDGRLKIWLDNRIIYQQLKRKRKGETVIVEEYDPQLEETQREERIEAVRARLTQQRLKSDHQGGAR